MALQSFIKKIANNFLDFTYSKVKYAVLPYKTKKILIVRFDAIGDYVLFRNFIEELKKNNRFSNYKFHYLGNSSYKDLAEHFEKDIVDRFYFLSSSAFNLLDRSIYRRLRFIIRFKLRCYAFIINPMHSRNYSMDRLVKELGSSCNIGSYGDMANYESKDMFDKGHLLYDRIVPVLDNTHFEFLRNKSFCENLLNTKLNTQQTFRLDKKKLDKKGLVLGVIVGAGVSTRIWSAQHFSTLIERIQMDFPQIMYIYLLGSPNEKKISDEILEKIGKQGKVKDCTGKSNLIEFVHIINELDFLISNETSAVHIAASVNTPTICISNGNHFGRFNPYPTNQYKIDTLYPIDAFYDPTQKRKLIEDNSIRSGYNINLISPETVIAHFERFYQNYLYD